MGRSHAVRGMTLRKWFTPFYDTGRRLLGLSPAVIDRAIGVHATAEANGRMVLITEPDGTQWTGTVTGWRSSKASHTASQWVNEFNWRAKEGQEAQPRP
jgi:hypothetical protein